MARINRKPIDTNITGSETIIGSDELGRARQYPIAAIGDFLGSGQTGAEIEALLDAELGNTEWKEDNQTGAEIEALLDAEIGNEDWKKAGLEGWEVARLTEGVGQWEANKLELQRAYATGSPVYIPPGTYEIDDCLLTGQTDCIIWANEVKFVRADDPLIITRETEGMLELSGQRDIFIYGFVEFDGNASASYAADYIMYVTETASPGRNYYHEHFKFTDGLRGCLYLNRNANIRTYENVVLNKTELINAHAGTQGVRCRLSATNIIVNYFYVNDGDPLNTKKLQSGWTNVRGALSIEGGESAIPSSYSENFYLGTFHAQYLKGTAFSHIGVWTAHAENILIENTLRNEDGTDPEVDAGVGSLILMKRNYAALSNDSLRKASWTYDNVVVKNTNNGKALNNYNEAGTTTVLVGDVEIADQGDEPPRWRINNLDSDCQGRYWNGSIGNYIHRGFSTLGSNYETQLYRNVTIDSLILDNRYALTGETRNNYILADGANISIGRIRGEGTSRLTFRALSEDLQAIVQDAVLDSAHIFRVEMWNGQFVTNGRTFKMDIYDSNIQGMDVFLQTTQRELVNAATFANFRDQTEVNAYNSIIRNLNDSYSFKFLVADAAGGFLRTPSISASSSKFIGSIILTSAEVYSGMASTREIDSSGFTTNLTPGSVENIQDLADAVDSLSIDQTAAEVPITDTGAFYTATDVEGVLQEIGPQLGGGGGGISNLVEDTTPQLGGNLDLNSREITGNGGLDITVDGTSSLAKIKTNGGTAAFIGAQKTDSSNYVAIHAGGSAAILSFATSKEFWISSGAFATFANERVGLDDSPVIRIADDGRTAIGVGTPDPDAILKTYGDVVIIGKINIGGVANLKEYTVATLPTGAAGDICYVTDSADTITYRSTVTTGGGTDVAMVFFDGTNWIYH